MAGHIAASGGLIKTNFRPIQTSRRPKRNSIGPKGSKKDSIAISMESILRNGKWLRRDNEISDPSSDRRRVAPSGYAPLIHGAGSDNRPFQDQGAHPPFMFLRCGQPGKQTRLLARVSWRSQPSGLCLPAFYFRTTRYSHAKTTECNPLPSQIVGHTVHKHTGTRVM
jgi:hypothetical protein